MMNDCFNMKLIKIGQENEDDWKNFVDGGLDLTTYWTKTPIQKTPNKAVWSKKGKILYFDHPTFDIAWSENLVQFDDANYVGSEFLSKLFKSIK